MTISHILFPSINGAIHSSFEKERQAAIANGFKIALLNEELFFGDQVKITGLDFEEADVLYRGWIMPTDDYRRLDQAVLNCGPKDECSLFTSHAAYKQCYNFANWYEPIKLHTPRSSVFPKTFSREPASFDAAIKAIQAQYKGGVVLKDYVKSRKHNWFDACFVPDTRDTENLIRVVKNIIADDQLVGGLVVREHVKLKQIGIHSKSRMPLSLEYRIFILDGAPLYSCPYWEEGDYPSKLPEFGGLLSAIVPKLKSRFYAVDIAEKEDGELIVVEINDGGSAGLLDRDIDGFYRALGSLVK